MSGRGPGFAPKHSSESLTSSATEEAAQQWATYAASLRDRSERSPDLMRFLSAPPPQGEVSHVTGCACPECAVPPPAGEREAQLAELQDAYRIWSRDVRANQFCDPTLLSVLDGLTAEFGNLLRASRSSTPGRPTQQVLTYLNHRLSLAELNEVARLLGSPPGSGTEPEQLPTNHDPNDHESLEFFAKCPVCRPPDPEPVGETPGGPPQPTWIVDLNDEKLPAVRRRDSPPVVLRGFASPELAENAAAQLNTLYAALRAVPRTEGPSEEARRRVWLQGQRAKYLNMLLDYVEKSNLTDEQLLDRLDRLFVDFGRGRGAAESGAGGHK
jgi:hypothetical protein